MFKTAQKALVASPVSLRHLRIAMAVARDSAPPLEIDEAQLA